jgi:hypothetical protein
LNTAFVVALLLTLQFTANVMHPPAPIQESGVTRIQVFFYLLVAVTMLASFLLARIFHHLDNPSH